MSDLRERIEQALFDAIEAQPRGMGGQVVSFYSFEDMPLRLRKIIQDQADAVLKVIADPPAEAVDRAAAAIAPPGVFGTTFAHYSVIRDNYQAQMQEDEQNDARADVRAVLAALVGGESDAV